MPDEDPPFPNLLVAIGASAGGLQAINELIGRLPEDFEAVIVVATHRDPSLKFNDLAEILDLNTRMRVRDPIEGERLVCQTLYVGPPSKALVVGGRDARLLRVEEEVLRMERIDALFETAARYAQENAIGVILSGMLWDGVEGLRSIGEAGGRCFVQQPAEAIFGDLPTNAISSVDIDCVGSVEEIADRLIEAAKGRRCVE